MRALLALLLLAAPPPADVAAPGFRSAPPVSSAPFRPAAGQLTVRGGTLEFLVGGDGALVIAEYLVDASRDGALALRFLSPAGSLELRVLVNGEVPAASAPPERKGMAATTDPLLESAFAARVKAGRNTIRVTYSQGFGLYRIPHGSLEEPGYLRVFTYELWPLKGWSLAPDFQLDLKVTVALPRTGPWRRLVGTVPSWTLSVDGTPRAALVEEHLRGYRGRRGAGAGAPPELPPGAGTGLTPVIPPTVGKLLGGTIEATGRMGRDFPDRLHVIVDKLDDRGTE